MHCDAGGPGETYAYCANCGSVNCPDHTKTERLEGTPVCSGCAVTERFALRTKYFHDEDNLERFREEYERMPIHEKAMENKPLVGGGGRTGRPRPSRVAGLVRRDLSGAAGV